MTASNCMPANTTQPPVPNGLPRRPRIFIRRSTRDAARAIFGASIASLGLAELPRDAQSVTMYWDDRCASDANRLFAQRVPRAVCVAEAGAW